MSAALLLERVREHLEYLKLRHMTQILETTLQEAAQEDLPPLEVLDRLLAHERNERWAWRVATAKKMSGLPADKTLEGFDFVFQPSADKGKIQELATLRFVANRENIIFLGPTGTGKTHLATALGLKAVEQGYQVLFTNAHELILKLQSWSKQGNLLSKWGWIRHIALLIIDEVGYLSLDFTTGHFF